MSGSLVFCISYETNTRKKENETKNAVNGYVLGIGTALGNRDSGIYKPSNAQHSKYNSKYSFFHKSLFGSEFYKRHATGCNTLFVTAKHCSLILISISLYCCKDRRLLIFCIIQNDIVTHMTPKQKPAITSVAKCTFNTILLRPIATASNNNIKVRTHLYIVCPSPFHTR